MLENGRAVAIWGYENAGVYGVKSAISNDFGATWTNIQFIDGNAEVTQPHQHIAMDENGNAIAIWHLTDPTQTMFWPKVASSSDYGATWSAPILLDAIASGDWSLAQIAMSVSGRSIAVWQRELAGFFTTRAAISGDLGTTWSSPVVLDPTPSENDGAFPSIAMDNFGNAIVTINRQTASADFDVVVVNTLDFGATWNINVLDTGVISSLGGRKVGIGISIPKTVIPINFNAIAIWANDDTGVPTTSTIVNSFLKVIGLFGASMEIIR